MVGCERLGDRWVENMQVSRGSAKPSYEYFFVLVECSIFASNPP